MLFKIVAVVFLVSLPAIKGSSDDIDSLWDMEGSGSAFDKDANVSITIYFNGTCASVFLQLEGGLSPYSQAFSITIRVIQCIFYMLVIILGISLNLFVFVTVMAHKKLRTVSFMVALEIVAINLVETIFLIISLTSAIANRWVFGDDGCAAVGMLVFDTAITRSLLLNVLVIDRFISIFCPFSYEKIKVKINLSLSVITWVFIIVISIILLPPILDCYTFSPNSWSCHYSAACNQHCAYFSYAFNATVVAPATIMPIALYLALYCKARSIRKKMREMTGGIAQTGSDWKATITFFLLFITVFALTVPTISFSSAVGAYYSDRETPPAIYALDVVSAHVLSLLVITDPVVIMRNADLKEIVATTKANMLKKWCPRLAQSRGAESRDRAIALARINE